MSYVKPDVSGRIYQNRLNFVNRYFQPPLDKIGSNLGPSPPLLSVSRLRSLSPLNDSLVPISPEKYLAPILKNSQDIPSIDRDDINRRFISHHNLAPNIILNPNLPNYRYRDLMLKQLSHYYRSPEPKLFVKPLDVNLSLVKPVAKEPILTLPTYSWIPIEKNVEPIYTQTIGIPRRRRIINYDTDMARTSSNFYYPYRRSLSNSNLNILKVF